MSNMEIGCFTSISFTFFVSVKVRFCSIELVEQFPAKGLKEDKVNLCCFIASVLFIQCWSTSTFKVAYTSGPIFEKKYEAVSHILYTNN